jgi:type II secretory pathway component PulF
VPLFRYEALDPRGNKVVGAMQVPDEQALSARLHSMGYQPTTVQVAQRTLTPAGRAATRAVPQTQLAQPLRSGGAVRRPSPAVSGPLSRLTADERSVARLFHQLHTAFRAGMPAYQAISTVAAQVPERPLREALTEIAAGVRDGATLSSLMMRYPRIFSRGDVGTMRAAEVGGFLPEALQSLAAQHEEDDNTRRRLRIWEWFFHSNVVGLLLFLAAAAFIPAAMEHMDTAVASGLRASGRVFLMVSLPLTLAYCGALMYFHRMRREPAFALKWHRFLLRLPVVGKIAYLRSNAVFTRSLQQLYHAGISTSEAWATAAGAVPNLFLSERLADGQALVESTGKVSLGMQQVGLHDPGDIGMVATGEVSGELDQCLHFLASRYEEDTRVALGASVVRGALTFTVWSTILTGAAVVLLAWSYYGNVFPAVNRYMGVE